MYHSVTGAGDRSGPAEFQQPFQLYREGEQTYLQWMGREVLHQSLEGRLALVHLLCKAGAGAGSSRQLFSPCVSFRIAGSPGRPVTMEEYTGDQSLTQRDYITIGGSSDIMHWHLITVIMLLQVCVRGSWSSSTHSG